MKKIVFILLTLVFFRCTKEAKVKLPEIKPVPVVNCFISPDDTLISLSLSRSKPIFETQTSNNFEPIEDAVVKISSSNGTAVLNFNPLTKFYETAVTSSFLLPGMKYTLTIETTDGKTVSAEATIPLAAPAISSVSHERILGQDNAFYDKHRISFYDDGSSSNYYRIGFADVTRNSNGDTTVVTEVAFRDLFTDINTNGSMMERQSDVYMYTGFQFGDSLIGRIFHIMSCDQPYYRYHESIGRYNNGNGNPFAEPTLIYTNIDGGLGIFAAYTVSVPYRKYY